MPRKIISFTEVLSSLKTTFRIHKRVPYLQQGSSVDCGAACLAMIFSYHGDNVDVREMRESLGIQRDGANAANLLCVAEQYGLKGKGLRVGNVENLAYIPAASILHWKLSHFVVFERLTSDGALIVDPAYGRRMVKLEELNQSFTGVVLTFEKSSKFIRSQKRRETAKLYFRALSRQQADIVGVLFTSALAHAIALVIPLAMSVAINVVIPRNDQDLLLAILLSGLAAVLFLFTTIWLRTAFLVRLKAKIDVEMSTTFLEHLIRLPMRFFQIRTAGDLVMRLNSNTEIRELISANAIGGILDGGLVSLYIVVLFFIDPVFALLIILLACSLVGVYLTLQRRQGELMALNLETQAKAQSLEYQMVSQMEVIKSAGAEDRVCHRWYKLFADSINVTLERGRIETISASYREALGMLGGVIIISYSVQLVINNEALLGNAAAMAALGLATLLPINRLVDFALQFRLLDAYFQRIADVLEEPREISGNRDVTHLRGKLELEHTSFSYSAHSPLILKDIHLKAEPGEFVAIVGVSGAGKSTLARLIAGLLSPDTGEIKYDNMNLAQLNLTQLRQHIGYVPQSPTFFSMTIENNIRLLCANATPADIDSALDSACIKDDILALPLGLNSLLAEGGVSLSGGQLQRLSLAVALARNPRVLILDEATSALDATTEKRVHTRIAELDCTRIVIAHRLSTVREADRIYILKDGSFIEQGTHNELMKEQGCYFELVRNQLANTQQVHAVS